MQGLKSKFYAAALSISAAGLIFIQGHEGTVQTAYLDAVGVPTICTGSTKKVFIGQKATLAECEERLQEDTSEAGAAVADLVKVKLSQGQYDALVSFTFNVGRGNLAGSTLLKRLNAGECRAAGAEFRRWVYAKGKKLRGLERRRAEEAAMFIKDC